MEPQKVKHTLESIIQEPTFVTWVLNPNPYLEDFWNRYVAQSEENLELVKAGINVVNQLHTASKPKIVKTDATKIWTSIQENIGTPFKALSWMRVGIAASIVIASIVSLYFLTITNNSKNMNITEKSPSKQIENTLVLEDGTKVLLTQGSKLFLSHDFNEKTRTVTLIGEAFFDVKKDVTRPFLIHANNVITKVLGTSFSIRAHKNQKVEVRVNTGKVQVFIPNPYSKKSSTPKEITLLPNQKVEVNTPNLQYIKSIVENPMPLIDEKNVAMFTYTDAPMSQILDALETIYGIEIAYNEKEISTCRLTTTMTNENLYQRLQVLCAATNAKYIEKEGKILISSSGCD
ncbi:MAG: FecR family protein [Leadbetterella sp.]